MKRSEYGPPVISLPFASESATVYSWVLTTTAAIFGENESEVTVKERAESVERELPMLNGVSRIAFVVVD